MTATGYQIVKRQTTAALKALVASKDKEEERLHCAVIDLLLASAAPGVVFFHCPNGGRRGKAEAARFKRMGVLAGVSDLCLSLPGGRFAFLEFKSSKGRLSQEQEGFLDAMEDNGHLTGVVNSIDQAVQVLFSWGAIRGARVAA